jgi:hypothetical protein
MPMKVKAEIEAFKRPMAKSINGSIAMRTSSAIRYSGFEPRSPSVRR